MLKKITRHLFLLIMFVLLGSTAAFAKVTPKTVKRIAIVTNPQVATEKDLSHRIQVSIRDLLRADYRTKFIIVPVNKDVKNIKKQTKLLQNKKNIDIVIATGLLNSDILAKLKHHKKPSVGTQIFDESVQGLQRNSSGKSKIKRFSYVKKYQNIANDLQQFTKIHDIGTVTIIADEQFIVKKNALTALIKTNQPHQILFINPKNFANQLSTIPRNGSVYILPLPNFDNQELQQVLTVINQNKSPSFAVQGKSYIDSGAMAGFVLPESAEIIARRVALNAIKMISRVPSRDLPIYMPKSTKILTINMRTARMLDIAPNFSVLKDVAMVQQFAAVDSERTITYQQALDMALANSLELEKLKKDIELSQTDILEAKRAFLPSIDVSYVATKVDDDFRKVQGAGLIQKVQAKVSQVLYSDQAISLYKARKLRMNASLEALTRIEYELVYKVLSAYVQHLDTKTQTTLQQDNIKKTRINLEVAKRKSAFGYAGKMDVYRLESELSMNKANLADAQANYQTTAMVLKRLLELPLDTAINFVDIQDSVSLLAVGNKKLFSQLNNTHQVKLFCDYLLNFAKDNKPAILESQNQIIALQKLTKAERRKWYVPTIAVEINGKKTIKRHDIFANMPERTLSPNWDVSLVASLPLFDKQQKTNNLKNTIQLQKLQLQKRELVQSIDLSIRSDMQTALASVTKNELFRKSVSSAEKSLRLVDKLYQHGQATISDLILAQNNLLNAKIILVQAEQKLFLDFLKVERNSGFYYFTKSDKEQNEFIDNFESFKKNISQQDKELAGN